MPGGRGGSPRVWEGIPSIPGDGGRRAWSLDGQTAERTGPDQVGVAGWVPGSAPPGPPPTSPLECYLASNQSKAGEEQEVAPVQCAPERWRWLFLFGGGVGGGWEARSKRILA